MIGVITTNHRLNQTFNTGAVLASNGGNVVLVVNARRTQQNALVRAIESLHRIEAHLCGVIVNELSRSARSYAYYGNYYASSYQDDDSDSD